jgi:YfiH family protein
MHDLDSAPLPVIRSRSLAQFPHLSFCMSTRQGEAPGTPFGFNLGVAVGDDAVLVDRRLHRFLERSGLEPNEIAFMDQVHGGRIAHATEAGEYPACDALYTRTPRLGLAVRVADCVPVLLYAPGEDLIAAIHAGWRGSAEGIAAATVEHLQSACGVDPSAFYAYIGPAAALCCYEVGAEVAARFAPEFSRPLPNGNAMLDLHAVNARQLVDAGLDPDNIEIDGSCTVHNSALFQSHRRDGARAGRMLAVITLLQEAE